MIGTPNIYGQVLTRYNQRLFGPLAATATILTIFDVSMDLRSLVQRVYERKS